MSIHFVSGFSRSPWGGCEELWSRAALALQQRGVRVSASVKYWPPSQRHPRLAALSLSGATLHFWGRRNSAKALLARAANKVAKSVRIPPLLPLINYGIPVADLVVFSSGGNEFPVAPVRLCRRRSQRYALIIQAVSESTWPRDSDLPAFDYPYEEAVAAFFVSNANRESTALQLGYDSERFRVVSNPFNVDAAVPFTWPEERPIHEWAFVGRLEPGHKGVDLLLRAFARDRWKGRNVRLNLYGSGFSEQSVQRMARMLQLDHRAVFHGQVGDIEKIWQTNELLLLPSRHEGLPLAVIEAMLCGRPCLVTNVSGNPEHLEDGVTGFLVRGPTVDEVDATLEKAWENKERLREMGECAYGAIRRRIPDDPAGRFADLLHELAV